jgi:hypothetical protein
LPARLEATAEVRFINPFGVDLVKGHAAGWDRMYSWLSDKGGEWATGVTIFPSTSFNAVLSSIASANSRFSSEFAKEPKK